LPTAQTSTGADWRIRFLSEKVVCRASLTRFYFGGFRGQEFSTATPDFANQVASESALTCHEGESIRPWSVGHEHERQTFLAPNEVKAGSIHSAPVPAFNL
jgi:hypothetical protein